MRGFSDDERDEIEAALEATARDRFERYGFQKTTVRDITEPVGIAESTFYRFFDSKAEVYVRVLLREQDELIDAVEAELAGVTDPEDQLDLLFRTWAAEFEERPLLRRSHQAPQEILRAIEHAGVEEAKRTVAARITPIVEDIQARADGLICDLRPETAFELLSVVELTVAQRDAHENLGWSGYDEFRDTLLTVMVRGLLDARSPGT